MKRRIHQWRRRWAGVDPRKRLLAWATAIAVLVGVLDAGAPLEIMLTSARNALAPRSASGQIVVVGIDEKSLPIFGQWPWPRRIDGELIERLSQLGAKRILVDFNFRERTDEANDSALERSLSRASPKVVLPVRKDYETRGAIGNDKLPLPRFRRHTDLASIDIQRNFMGQVLTLPHSVAMQDGSRPTMAALLAQQPGTTSERFPIDYAIRFTSIPYLSASDVLKGKVSRSAVAGKQVIIGATAETIGDMYVFPGQGALPGVYLHVLGAETLLHGKVMALGWAIPLILTALSAFAYLLPQRRSYSLLAVSATYWALIAGPALLARFQIFVTVMPALTLLTTLFCAREWARFRSALHLRGTTNIVSGLPNLTALREAQIEIGTAITVARVQNFADITSALPPDAEQSLVEQIAARLKMGGATEVYQGDEGIFVWIVPETDTALLGERLDALHTLFRSPVAVTGRRVDVSVNFGVDTSSERLTANRLSSALVAAAEAAEDGRRWKAYDPQRLDDAEWKLSLLGELDAAIDSGALWVAYQPKLDLATNRITGAEALVRWSHPTRGEIAPDQFIATAEHHNRIDKLTRLVLDEALRTAAEINHRGFLFTVAVNLSARLLDGPWIAETVEALLGRHRLTAQHLTLEITESAAIANDRAAMALLEKLRAMGVAISIDDYGTGMSTLDYLRSIPATEIKIDKRFVSQIDKNGSDRVMVSSTIQLAHSLGRTVVAEGVETSEILSALVAMGCDTAQGYLIGHPMKIQPLLRMLMMETPQALTN